MDVFAKFIVVNIYKISVHHIVCLNFIMFYVNYISVKLQKFKVKFLPVSHSFFSFLFACFVFITLITT